jgi:hypothetical protein
MSSAAFSSAEQLVEGILKGQVPRQIRLFAAQGLLPVSREDLMRLQVVLSADPDPELAQLAGDSVRAVEEGVLDRWIRSTSPAALELDLLIRLRREEPVWAAVATNARVSNETLRTMARGATPLVQDILITNQVRILGCLEMLEDLRVNPQVSQVVLRRVKEFEEEFIEKAIAAGGDLPELAQAPSIEEALAALRAIGAHIPGESELPIPVAEDPVVHEEVHRQGVNVFGKILRMNVKELIVLGLKGSREERAILINSRNHLVVRAVLASPKLSPLEVERFAASRSVGEEVIRTICGNRRWVRRYGVMMALAQNPKTPVQIALRLLPSLSKRDLTRLTRDRNTNPVVRRQALALFEARE